ncbi:MAG: NAD-dependent epimerase/dehydratase family protein [Planctomycetota bacterium]|jgi:UDP-glucose 4-epimerase
MRVLVTGGCGLIGSSVVERALRDDARVTVLDNLSSGSRDHLPHDPRVELVVGDVCDESLVGALVPRCDAVFHLAAGVGVGLILARPTGSLRASLLGSEIVLRHAAAARRPVFFASTSEVYGDSDGEPLREERNVGFGSPDTLRFSYAAGKAAGEALAFAYAAEYGLPVVVGRFFNVTGPRQSGEHGAVVPAFVDQALAGGPIEIHGDGKQTRCPRARRSRRGAGARRARLRKRVPCDPAPAPGHAPAARRDRLRAADRVGRDGARQCHGAPGALSSLTHFRYGSAPCSTGSAISSGTS